MIGGYRLMKLANTSVLKEILFTSGLMTEACLRIKLGGFGSLKFLKLMIGSKLGAWSKLR